ncbi:tryptophan synthase alpha chain [Sporosarcina sp. NCCP-2716]|uniref:tryptophan synthase subunit alpha n=1 Tax=Sporosarcina sp. NCCP-2716 TaxID=2943679 RepID=UPI00203EE77C|nr:tryptophan synthase subunit alpha [Sporosarcina sp. NCCP-2716]GKV68506.1 tryptophan synthase alpha chain [Sporosarcina sp. NCCP-2716]
MKEQALTRILQEKKQAGQQIFVPYMMAGDGGIGALHGRIEFLAAAGADAVEIGIPFSDPSADGEVIQQAGERALSAGTTLRKVLDCLAERSHDIPLIVMTYLNPIIAMGIPHFLGECRRAGVLGLIVPDLPHEERSLLTVEMTGSGIALIPLVSLMSSPERVAMIAEEAEGFIYAVTVNGITGERNSFGSGLGDHLAKLKEASEIPVLAGFGISNPAQVEKFQKLADGVIVGSAVVEAFRTGDLDIIRELAGAGRRRLPQYETFS